jgi:hypothetical protein
MPKARFAGEGEELVLSLPHTLQLANAAYAALKNGDPAAAKQLLGLQIGYLRGTAEAQE